MIYATRCTRGFRWAWTLVALFLTAAGAAGQTYFVRGPDQTADVNKFPFFGDYDNDGWPDLYVKTIDNSATVLLHNEGNGSFTDQGASLRAQLVGLLNGGGCFGDYDNDGDLDLFLALGWVAKYQPDRLLRNDQGVFTDVTKAAALRDSLPTVNAIWLDYDRDGWLDLYTGNQMTGTTQRGVAEIRNLLHRNQGDGSFTEVTHQAGLDLQLSAHGGSSGGMVAADFDDDGWPDLYVHVNEGRDRLFLNDRQGGFTEAPLPDPVEDQYAFGMAAGDVDNDGDLDLFLAAGGYGPSGDPVRSRLLLNLGGALFVDATDALGLSQFSAVQLQGPTLADIDNDGDLDLITADPATLMLNDGQGVFTDATDQSGFLRAPQDSERYLTMAVADYDLDGFLDLWGGTLWRNNGNGNHWLRIELVGRQSNRFGIGAILVATAGDLRQRRDLLGGNGLTQDEPVVHFGLGHRTQVDRLEIRWPSGQVDVLTDLPADQSIRVFEGQPGYHPVLLARWTETLPDVVAVGSDLQARLGVRPALFAPGARVTSVTADLSQLGGPAVLPLEPAADGTWQVQTALTFGSDPRRRIMHLLIQQATPVGDQWTRLTRTVLLAAVEDAVLLDEGAAPEWGLSTYRVDEARYAAEGTPVRGAQCLHLQARGGAVKWQATLTPAATVYADGYTSLHLAIRLGETTWTTPTQVLVSIAPSRQRIDLVSTGRLDLTRRDWQTVEIPIGELAVNPMGEFAANDPITRVRLEGNTTGEVYLDDFRLVAAKPSVAPGTAVLESQTNTLPAAFALAQNYPNPFNSSTVIEFSLAAAGEVEAVVYDLAGQQVVTLAQGSRPAGTHLLAWDGRDDQGRLLASGVYLCRLTTAGSTRCRKMLLLR